jgi:hypothetical protein
LKNTYTDRTVQKSMSIVNYVTHKTYPKGLRKLCIPAKFPLKSIFFFFFSFFLFIYFYSIKSIKWEWGRQKQKGMKWWRTPKRVHISRVNKDGLIYITHRMHPTFTLFAIFSPSSTSIIPPPPLFFFFFFFFLLSNYSSMDYLFYWYSIILFCLHLEIWHVFNFRILTSDECRCRRR